MTATSDLFRSLIKKTIIPVSIVFLLLGCNEKKKVKEIDNFVAKIDSSTDLIESLTEFESEINGTNAIGGFDIHTLMDMDSTIHKVYANVSMSNDSLTDYEFYYQNDTVVFARILQFKETKFDTQKLDTLTNSDFYFYKGELIERIDRKDTDLEIKTVKWVAESYFVFGRDYK